MATEQQTPAPVYEDPELEEMTRELFGPLVEAEAPTTDDVLPATEPEETPEAAPAGDETETPAEQASETDAQPDEAPQQAQAKPEHDWKAEYEKLEQSHKVLQGKYNAEVPRFANENRQIREEMAALKAQMESVAKANEGASPAKQVAEQNKLDELKRQIADTFGDEAAEGMTTLVREMLQAEVAPLRQTIEQQKKTQAQRDWEAFIAKVDAGAPGWDQTQDTPEFREWAGDAVMHQLSVWGEAKDDARIINTFKAFEKFQQATAPPPESSTTTVPDGALQRKALKAQVSPRVGATPSTSSTEKVRYTAKQYQTLLQRIDSGEFPPDQAAKLEAELQAALIDERVDGLFG